jgi:hypothetical protein
VRPKLEILRRLIVVSVLTVICATAIHFAISSYQETKSIERTLDALGTACAERGGCTLPTADFW